MLQRTSSNPLLTTEIGQEWRPLNSTYRGYRRARTVPLVCFPGHEPGQTISKKQEKDLKPNGEPTHLMNLSGSPISNRVLWSRELTLLEPDQASVGTCQNLSLRVSRGAWYELFATSVEKTNQNTCAWARCFPLEPVPHERDHTSCLEAATRYPRPSQAQLDLTFIESWLSFWLVIIRSNCSLRSHHPGEIIRTDPAHRVALDR